ncbi:UNC80 domain-containing protein [Lamellibrachia satsuma]|nr:UNC80 domain-containing protein [Lamellibrachia satsuma]
MTLPVLREPKYLHPDFWQLKGEKHAEELRQIAHLSYTAFLSSITELNKLTQEFSDVNGKKLVFELKDGTTSTVFWKVTAKLQCNKVNCHTTNTESSRVLNLRQYVRLYNEIAQQASIVTQPMDTASAKSTDIRASTIFAELDRDMGKESTSDDEECCICMEHKAVVILPCAHTYCEVCIDTWSTDHKTCPVCRAAVRNSCDNWVLTEKPDSSQMAVDMADYLLGLADRSGSATSPND